MCPASRRSTSSVNVPNRFSSSSPMPSWQHSACLRRKSSPLCSGRTPSRRRARSTRGARKSLFESMALTIASVADTPIVAAGRMLKLSDVAEVHRGYEDPPTFLIRSQGEPTIMLAAVMQEGWDGLALGKALRDKAAAIAQTLPLGMTLEKVTDQAVNISSAVDEFMLKFAMALGVVLLVSLLSLGWRVGIVVAAAVPLTLAVVFLIMLETGRFFDRITLGALILALGLLVDDAIIAIEVMVVKMEEGMDRIKAAAYAWSHTAAPMLVHS